MSVPTSSSPTTSVIDFSASYPNSTKVYVEETEVSKYFRSRACADEGDCVVGRGAVAARV